MRSQAFLPCLRSKSLLGTIAQKACLVSCKQTAVAECIGKSNSAASFAEVNVYYFQQFAVISSTNPATRKKILQDGGFVKLGSLAGRISRSACAALVMVIMCAIAWAQSPIDAEGGFLANQGAQPRFESGTKISGQAELALRTQRVLSIPHFTGSFAFNGQTFPFNVVGTQPQVGGVTRIPTQVKPVTLLFEGYEDEKGDPIVLSPEPVVLSVRNSPNFRSAQYQTGFTQFADAVQRAQFYNAMAQ